VASVGPLTDRNAARSEGHANATAAVVAFAADRSIDAAVAARAAGLRRLADAERRAGGDVTETTATIARVRAHVSILDAPRPTEIAHACLAELGAAVLIGGASVARGAARAAQRLALSAIAGASTAFAVAGAGAVVGNAGLAVARSVVTRERTAIRRRAAKTAGCDAPPDAGRTGVKHGIANPRTAIGSAAARSSRGAACARVGLAAQSTIGRRAAAASDDQQNDEQPG